MTPEHIIFILVMKPAHQEQYLRSFHGRVLKRDAQEREWQQKLDILSLKEALTFGQNVLMN